eukprot:TRINITY_DN2240_c0_g1_i2.p1 TRINITY_DN2240_c0_g1~~TRINITY_DN2240_c0_g1_i2.p1  ORF type:complete len:220 (+),score=71.60 TRINITY_DN2240_c0_g1_i2:344-1003(+)
MSAKLTYVNGRGRAEIIRLLLVAANIEYENCYLESKQDLEDVRNSGKSFYGQVPMLEIDGRCITQTNAMVYYIARNYNLYGETEDDKVKIDMLYDGFSDTIKFIYYPFKNGKEEFKQNQLLPMIKRYFPVFSNCISENNNNEDDSEILYFVGNSLSIADLYGYHHIDWAIGIFGQEYIESNYPKLMEFYNKLTNHPNVNGMIKPFPGDDYVALCSKVFH